MKKKEKVDPMQPQWDARWDAMFAALVRYKRWHGDCRVPASWAVNPDLANWVRQQRQDQQSGKLRPDRCRRLERLGFVWLQLADEWERGFAALVDFRARYGHCRVPWGWREDPRFAAWVARQRRYKRIGRLSPERIGRLDAIGFEWVAKREPVRSEGLGACNERWDRMFTALERFKQRHGHCWVPAGRPGNQRMAFWVCTQRRLKRLGRLREDRYQRLHALGFEWEVVTRGRDREKRLWARLVEFHRRFGHSDVPGAWREDQELGVWVIELRCFRRKGSLSDEKVRRLDTLGFVWDVKPRQHAQFDKQWSARLAELAAFHREHGHWQVPSDQPELWSLRIWMDNQRALWRRGCLSADRFRRLDEICFPWNTARWTMRAKAAVAPPQAGLPRPVIERAKEVLRNLEESELTPEGQPKIAQHEHGRGKGKVARGKGKAKPGKVSEPPPQMFLFGDKVK